MPCVACGSLRGWQVCCGISGKFAVECAATLLWNQWQVWRGIGGNFRMERVATFVWNGWQLSRGIRIQALCEYGANPGAYVNSTTPINPVNPMNPINMGSPDDAEIQFATIDITAIVKTLAQAHETGPDQETISARRVGRVFG